MSGKKSVKASSPTVRFIKKYWDFFILGFLIVLYIGVLGSLSVLRHNAFASGFDLSNMDQTVYYTLHGHFFQFRHPEEFVSRFSVHADLILILLSPLYLIKDDVRMLIVSESVFLALGAIPTYLLARRLLKDKLVALALVAIYLLNPGMQWTDIYEFHPVSLAIPFFLFALYFAYTKQWKWYGVFVFLTLLTKEQIALNIAMLGLAVFFVFKNRLIGLTTFLTGISWFFVMVYIVMPYFTPSGTHWALAEYGETNTVAIINRYTDVSQFLNTFLLESKTVEYYILLLKQFAFLPLLGLPWLLLSSPDLAINVLRESRMITLHYDSGVTPGLMIASIFGMYYLQALFSRLRVLKPYSKYLLYTITLGSLLVALRVNYNYSPLPTTPSCWCFIYNVTDEDKEFEKALQQIPKNASVTASIEIRPHVSHRDLAFTIPSATDSADYIALITQNRLIGNYEPKDIENRLLPILLSDTNHKLLFKGNYLYLFQKVKTTEFNPYSSE